MSYYEKPKSLGSILDAWVSRMGWQDKLDESRIIESWAEMAGPQINAVTDSVWMKNHVLFIKVTSAPWRHELHLRRDEWTRKLNDRLGRDFVHEIVFR